MKSIPSDIVRYFLIKCYYACEHKFLTMKITILVENTTALINSKHCASEWGFSTFIETQQGKFLFDVGHSDIYWKNAQNLGIDLNVVDSIFLSHRHWDHVCGLRHHKFSSPKKLLTHPDTVKHAPVEIRDIIRNDFEYHSISGVKEFADGCFFLGEIPLMVPWEKGLHEGEHLKDDSALAFKIKNGAIVLTGCSHSGISNICEYAKKVTGQSLHAVVGGFHLVEDDVESINGTIQYFKSEKPRFICPMHCIDFPTSVQFYNELGITKFGAGDVLEFND